jgi:transposase
LWGDACGYVWGQRNDRIRIPIVNEKSRSSYFGALNVVTGRVAVKKYDYANSESAIKFLKYLLNTNRGCKITIFWDGVGYHRSNEIKRFLDKVNKGCEKMDARLMLVRLAPNAPEENPIEDVWLHGKNNVRRKIDHENFGAIQATFEQSVKKKKFNFNKIKKYNSYYE